MANRKNIGIEEMTRRINIQMLGDSKITGIIAYSKSSDTQGGNSLTFTYNFLDKEQTSIYD